MLITCSECDKKLKVADSVAGKKVRCPHCRAVTLAPKLDEDPIEKTVEGAPPQSKKQAALKQPTSNAKKPIKRDDVQEADDDDEEETPPKEKPRKRKAPDDDDQDEEEELPADRLACAQCNSTALADLPANHFTRRPGYVCKKCGQKMRQPGSTVLYLIGIVLGVTGILGGIAFSIFALLQERINVRAAGGGAILVIACISLIGFSLNQMRLPIPKNAPPVRWVLWICVTLAILFVVSILLGGCFFAFSYFLNEML